MKRSFLQISGTLLLLIGMLVVPLFIQSISSHGRLVKPEISASAATDSKVLGESISIKEETRTKPKFEYNEVRKYALYTIVVLFMISVASFIKYKVSKK